MILGPIINNFYPKEDTLMKNIFGIKCKAVGILSLIAAFPSWGQEGVINDLQSEKVVGRLEDRFSLNLTELEKAGLMKVVTTNPIIRHLPIESTEDYQLLKSLGRSIRPSVVVDSQVKKEFLKDIEGISLEGQDPSEILRSLGEKVGNKLNFNSWGIASERFIDGGGRTETN